MTDSKLNEEQRLQAELNDLREVIDNHHSFDTTSLLVKVTVLEESKVGRRFPYKQRLSLTDENSCLLALELENIEELENYQGLIDFLGTVDGDVWPIGTVLQLNRIELQKSLDDNEIAALTHISTLLLQCIAELILTEEAEMLRQPIALQETWIDMYGIRDEKRIEYNGIRYIRSDAISSWHY